MCTNRERADADERVQAVGVLDGNSPGHLLLGVSRYAINTFAHCVACRVACAAIARNAA